MVRGRFHPWEEIRQNLTGSNLAESYGRIHVFHPLEAMVLQDPRQVAHGQDFFPRSLELSGLLLEQFLPQFGRVFPLLLIDPVLDTTARTGGVDEGQPIAAGACVFGGQDLDNFAVLELIAEGHDAIVDFGPDATMTDLGVNRIREVDGCGVAWKCDDLQLGRKAIDLVGIQIHLQAGQKVPRVADLALRIDELPQPAKLLLSLHNSRFPFLVFPMCRDAFFRDTMHLLRAYLNLERLAVLTYDRSVERLVEVRAGYRDVIFDTAGDRPPEIVNGSQNGVTVLDAVCNDANGDEVEHLVDADLLALHLLVYAINSFDPALQPGRDVMLGKLRRNRLFHLLDKILTH